MVFLSLTNTDKEMKLSHSETFGCCVSRGKRNECGFAGVDVHYRERQYNFEGFTEF